MATRKNITSLALIIGLLALSGLAHQVLAWQNNQRADKPKKQVPAHFTDLKDVKEIPKTLSPDQFTDPLVKKAYTVAQENPKLLMQIPCFCYCDRSMGHQSLLSCYIDDHAAHCDICRDEAIEADRLLKEEKLPVEQIREKIIKEFSS